ncbi:MAG: M60 family metallopeptidase [Eubacterium sp.]|nr:M60 family metallopeptidase [Eubacterium sp.]
MKRYISSLLAVILVFLSSQQAMIAKGAASAPPGQVNVTIISALRLEDDVDFTVSLSGKDERILNLEKDTGELLPSKTGTVYENLEQGTYTLTVQADGFARYEQKIQVGDKAYGVKLMTGDIDLGAAQTQAHPGVLRIGDVNGDGQIDVEDKKLITDILDESGSIAASTQNQEAETETPEQNLDEESKRADLNRDGKVDLADLEYFTKSYQAAPVESSVEASIPSSKVKAATGSNTKTNKGSIEDLFNNRGMGVQLSASNGLPISPQNPVSVDFAFDNSQMEGMVFETGTEYPVSTAEVEITEADGNIMTLNVPNTGLRSLDKGSVTAAKDANGTICIQLGKQVAVKKVTFRVTGMEKDKNSLAEISKVTFLDDMASRIPEPAADIPANVKAENGSASFTLSWSKCDNVTGYEVCVWEDTDQAGAEKKEYVRQVTGTTLTVSSLDDRTKIENYKKYKAKVRSVNGMWRSGYSAEVSAEPKPTKKPDAPDYVKAAGQYQAVRVSWKMMKNTVTYNLYYKKENAAEYTKIEGISDNFYTVENLENLTKYLFYVTGVNELGEGAPSLTAAAMTKDMDLAKVPRYRLINKAENGAVSPKIVHAATGSGGMKSSPKDTEAGTAWGSVDNNANSYYEMATWDGGGYNSLGGRGLIYEFDQAYQIKMIALQEPIDQDTSYGYAKIQYWDADNQPHTLGNGNIAVLRKTDAEGRVYYMLRFDRAVTAKKIQIGLARSVASGTITVAEMYFYEYDPVEDDIMGLYTDDLHTVLRSDVTHDTIDALRVRINTKEAESGEYHPDRDLLERELKTAEDILDSKLNTPVHIHSGITTKDVGRGFGGLNAWQPLGITAAAGEQITVYVGHGYKRTGDNTSLQLVATQYHAEAASMSQVVKTLKIGRNDIVIPKIWSGDFELGGALYVQYTGSGGAEDEYAVRVSGGVEVPVLDLYQVTDQTERMARISKYLADLGSYVSQMQAKHREVHEASANLNVHKAYDEKNCILGATDILLDTMMLSLPAAQVLSGSKSNAETLSQSMNAMEEMMYLFYQHKGLNKNAKEAIDQIPKGHQNIRYQRMFAGAFMYASGNHIGIEYGSTAGMVSGKPVQKDENGRWVSGQYFGWGIAHEIGHCINQGAYSIAEITNNYFSVLAQAKETNSSVRFVYYNEENPANTVFGKVTSNTKGRASNVFTQLGMYWQLHLAYDDGYNYKTYDDHQTQLDRLFFARVDSYARKPDRAPKPGGVALTLPGDTDQNLMRLACAAAKKDLLEFFERWGMTPDEGTIKYAEQFEKEERAIYYANDEARAYRLTNGGTGSGANSNALAASRNYKNSDKTSNQVEIRLSAPGIATAGDVLGYEIVRCTVSEDKSNGLAYDEEFAGFKMGNGKEEVVFTDTVSTINNRAVTYKVRLIDKYLCIVDEKTLAPIKICHEDFIDKAGWTISTNQISVPQADAKQNEDADGSIYNEGEADVPCGVDAKKELARRALEKELGKMIDNDSGTSFTANVEGAQAEIILEFNRSHAVTGFQYTGAAIGSYDLYVRDMNGAWVKAGSFSGNDDTDGKGVYFAEEKDEKNIAKYQTTAVKLVISGQTTVSIAELDVRGISGDNVEFEGTFQDQPAIGILDSDVSYGNNQKIPQGSLVFVGSYKGNPAYNVVSLFHKDGKRILGTDTNGDGAASQIIFAEVPKTGKIQDVSEGTWVYWIEPGQNLDSVIKELSGKEIRAELYRVDDPFTLEGQRYVSDTLPLKLKQMQSISDLDRIHINPPQN